MSVLHIPISYRRQLRKRKTSLWALRARSAKPACLRGILPASYTTHCWCVVLVIFQSGAYLKNTRATFSPQFLRSHKCGIIHTCYDAFMIPPTTAFMWWEKRVSQLFSVNFLFKKCEANWKRVNTKREARQSWADEVRKANERAVVYCRIHDWPIGGKLVVYQRYFIILTMDQQIFLVFTFIEECSFDNNWRNIDTEEISIHDWLTGGKLVVYPHYTILLSLSNRSEFNQVLPKSCSFFWKKAFAFFKFFPWSLIKKCFDQEDLLSTYVCQEESVQCL